MFTERITNWKQIIAGFAIFGFILSFIIGLFGGVVFGIIILRAFIFALVFSCISILIMVLIERFIPELIDAESGEEDEIYSESADIIDDNDDNSTAEHNIKGGNLDITIEDENPVEHFETNRGVLEKENSEIDRDSAVHNAGEEVAAELVEELEEIEAADLSDSISSDEISNNSYTVENKDMPDIGDFADSFTAADVVGNGDGNGLSNIDGMGSSTGAEIMGDMHDTEDMIKAVKTVLKKDQEG